MERPHSVGKLCLLCAIKVIFLIGCAKFMSSYWFMLVHSELVPKGLGAVEIRGQGKGQLSPVEVNADTKP